MTPEKPQRAPDTVQLALPKGRIQEGVFSLLLEAGIRVTGGARGYRPSVSLAGFEAKLLKTQNVVEMLALGSRDVGFAGADWVAEKGADLIELLDTGLDPVRLVAAAPPDTSLELLRSPRGPSRAGGRSEWVVASEYERLAQTWMGKQDVLGRPLRTYGATEVFPPEDADVIVDNTATGATLRANGLEIIDELMVSSTRLYANPRAYEDPIKRPAIEALALCLTAVVAARARAMVELNVARADLPAIVEALPCMREPTVSDLAGNSGYAVRAAVVRADLPELVPALKARGATDIVVSSCEQIVP